jgi:hypothetical protein
MPLPKKHATLDKVQKKIHVKDDANVLEEKTYIPMALTTDMKLNKKKKNTMKMNDVFVTDDKQPLGSIVKPAPLLKNKMNAHQYKDAPIQMPSMNEFRY